jgi:DNA-binding MarR family transcriptional regulator
MTADQLLRRKFLAGYSDLHCLLLLRLAQLEMATLSDLAGDLGRPTSTVGGACAAMMRLGNLTKDADLQPYAFTYYSLTDTGKRRVAWLLGQLPETYEFQEG